MLKLSNYDYARILGLLDNGANATDAATGVGVNYMPLD